MALHYDYGPLYKAYCHDNEAVMIQLQSFIATSKHVLKALKEAIDLKQYEEVLIGIGTLRNALEFLGMEQALEDVYLMEAWVQKKGKTKEVKETYRSFKQKLKDARKELKKDFNL